MSIARFEKRMIGWLIDKLIFPGCPRGHFWCEILYFPKDFHSFSRF
jgi:hypothetical protein